ncbi:MAG TPA: DUF4232 domain-containing protein [Streptosporangiaceae bacterium]|nr:DUF4232 domain-containing protein [Streptosporangiaceae bacterium]
MSRSALGRRGKWMAGIVVATSWLATACGSSASPQAGASPSVTVSGSTSTAPSTVPSSSTTDPGTPASPTEPSTVPPSAVGLVTCSTTSLVMTVDDSQAGGGAGSSYYPLNFTNTSDAACEMYGFPGVSFVTAPTGQGQQVGVTALRSGAFAKVAVRLAPGGTAHAWLKVATALNYPVSGCQPVTVHWLRVYPPGETAAGYVSHTFTACSSTSAPLLTVLPVRLGSGVAGSTP